VTTGGWRFGFLFLSLDGGGLGWGESIGCFSPTLTLPHKGEVTKYRGYTTAGEERHARDVQTVSIDAEARERFLKYALRW